MTTKKSLRRAVLFSGIRKDIQRVRRILVVVAVLMGLLSVLTILPHNGSVNVAGVPLWLAFAWFLYGVLRFASRGVLKYQLDRLGPHEGQIDHLQFDWRTTHHDCSMPIDALVACDWNRKRAVMSFDSGLDQIFVCEFDEFEDPEVARGFFQNLHRLRPPVAREMKDPRRVEQPDVPPRFSVPASESSIGPIFFDGPVYFHDIAAMTFRTQYQRKLIQGSVILFLIWVAFGWLCSLFETRAAQTIGPILMGIYFLWVIGRLVLQVRTIEQSDTPLFWSKGWVSDGEYVAITQVGQARVRWDYFERVQVNDDAIQMKTKSIPKWYFVTRNQFQSDADWAAAGELIRGNVERGSGKPVQAARRLAAATVGAASDSNGTSAG